LPDITFEGESSIYFNGEQIRLLTLPAGHTDSDLIVYFTKSKVAHIGDLYVPPLGGADRSNGGRFLGLIDGLAFVIRELPGDAKVIPAHGPPISMNELVRSYDVLSKTAAFLEQSMRAGKTLEQLKGSSELAPLRAVLPADQVDWFLEGMFRELARR
jgi:glyoxylase-like metal-dependent hydrolase (beta-lactamase superfamily II)